MIMFSRAILFTVIGLVAIGAPAFGAPPASSTHAGPYGTNLFGLEGLFFPTTGTALPSGTMLVGGSFLLMSNNEPEVDVKSVPVTFTYGFDGNFDMALAFEVYRSIDSPGFDESGVGDLYLSGKYAVQPRTAVYPAMAVGARLKVPTAEEGLGSDETDFAIFGAADILMNSVQGLLNVEYVFVGGTDAVDQVNYSVGLRIPYSDSVDFAVELIDQELTGDLIAGGATFDMGSTLNFGFGVGLGLNEPAADFAVQGKFTFSL